MIIRKGTKEDLPRALELIRELAICEDEMTETNTLLMMENDGFGEHPVYGFIVAEEAGTIHGMSMYYWRYSTWKGKRIYLEDPHCHRGQKGFWNREIAFRRDHRHRQGRWSHRHDVAGTRLERTCH